MVRELPRIPGVGRFLGGMDANFLLTEILDQPREAGGTPSNENAMALYERSQKPKASSCDFGEKR